MDEGGYSHDRALDGKEHNRISDAYNFVGEVIDPFMGDWIDQVRTDRWGVVFEKNRYAFSGPVSIEGDTWMFAVQENLRNIAGTEFSTYQIGGFDGKSIDSQVGLYVVTPGVVRARSIELRTQEEFEEFKRTVKFIGQHLIKPSISS